MNLPSGQNIRWILTVLVCCQPCRVSAQRQAVYPEGYYAFEESTSIYKKPPTVRKPPYFRADVPCPGADPAGRFSPGDTLCGDLNKGFIPRNPMGPSPFQEPYPFDLIKNKTLKFLGRALPFLRRDVNVPKVARFVGAPVSYREPGGLDYHQIPLRHHRSRRSTHRNSTQREACPHRSRIWCSLSNALRDGKLPHTVLGLLADAWSDGPTSTPPPEAQDAKTHQLLSLLTALAADGIKKASGQPEEGQDRSPLSHIVSVVTGASSDDTSPVGLMIDLMAQGHGPLTYLSNLFPARRRRPASHGTDQPAVSQTSKVETGLPPTPCPSVEDYVTPTFARNYRGVWKYVVQIPSEGYFTQTVQRTKCVRNRCDFTDGVCHESPRWVSLLVAEVFYPDTYFPTSSPSTTSGHPYQNEIPPVEDFSSFQQYLKRRVGQSEAAGRPHPVSVAHRPKEDCDGYDQIGCYLVRVYYDWFLVNGSCKCWKPSAARLFKSRSAKNPETNPPAN